MNDPTQTPTTTAEDSSPEWGVPLPEVIPRSTYFPAALAFGLTLMLWGLITSPVVLGAGLTVIVASLRGWIGELLLDR